MPDIKVKQITRVIKVHVSGRRGPQGDTGPQGPPGDSAASLVQSVNGRIGHVTGLAEQSSVDSSINGKVNKIGDTMTGELSITPTDVNDNTLSLQAVASQVGKLLLLKDAAGNTVFDISPGGTITVADNKTLFMASSQDEDDGRLIRLKFKEQTTPAAKAIIAFENEAGVSKAWLVTHYASVSLDPESPSIHQHFSIETTQSNGEGVRTRMEIPWDQDIAEIGFNLANVTLRRNTGETNGNLTFGGGGGGGSLFHYNKFKLYPKSDPAGGNNSTYALAVDLGGASSNEVALSVENSNILYLNDAFYIKGTSDTQQLRVVGNSTQTSSLVLVEKSDGTDLLAMDNNGNMGMLGSLVVGSPTGSATGKLDVRGTARITGDADTIQMIVKGNSTQVNELFIAQDSTGNNLFVVNRNGGVIINEQGAATNTRIEGDTDANLVFVDGTNDRVGIGISTPAQKLHVSQANGTGDVAALVQNNAATNGETASLLLTNSTTPGNVFGRLQSRRVDGNTGTLHLGIRVGAVLTDIVDITSTGVSIGGSLTLTNDLNMTSHKVTNVTNPDNAQDAATKSYVDTADALKANDNTVVKVTGNQTIAGVKTFTDALAPSAGITPINTWNIWATGNFFNALNLSSGTVTTPVSGTIYIAAALVLTNTTITGIRFTVPTGSAGTDKVIVAIYSAAGTLLGNSNLAGVTVEAPVTKQAVPLTSPISVTGPNKYFIGLQFNGTAARFLTFSAPTGKEDFAAGEVTGNAFGTVSPVAMPSTYTFAKGPYASTY